MRGLSALLAVVVVAMASCDRPPAAAVDDSKATPRDVSTSMSPGEPTEVDGAAEAAMAFRPHRDDVYRELKRTAGRLVQDLTTYSDTDSWRSVTERVSSRFGLPPMALKVARAVYVPSTSSVGEIVYPQLGGLVLSATPQNASVMVVVRQTLDDATAVSRTFDVRLRLESERWRVDSLGSAGGAPADGEVSGAARAVLEDPRIELADSARWDIYRGDVDGRLLRLMARLARTYTYSVTVLRSGHPPHVYGTEHVSNHTEGRAVDIWEVDGIPVVTQRDDPSSAAYRFTQAVYERGDVPELGSPWDLDGAGGPSFTNDVHLDHIHIAYDAEG